VANLGAWLSESQKLMLNQSTMLKTHSVTGQKNEKKQSDKVIFAQW